MRVFHILTDVVDREIRFLGGPVFTLLASCLPIVALAVLFDGRPADLPMTTLLPALALAAAWGTFVIWRYLKFKIEEFRELRALAAEEEARERHG